MKIHFGNGTLTELSLSPQGAHIFELFLEWLHTGRYQEQDYLVKPL